MCVAFIVHKGSAVRTEAGGVLAWPDVPTRSDFDKHVAITSSHAPLHVDILFVCRTSKGGARGDCMPCGWSSECRRLV